MLFSTPVFWVRFELKWSEMKPSIVFLMVTFVLKIHPDKHVAYVSLVGEAEHWELGYPVEHRFYKHQICDFSMMLWHTLINLLDFSLLQ